METRFWNKVNIKSDNECWEWTGCIRDGYGQFRYNKMVNAHRVAYELYHKRPITEGLHILHSCDNRKCCNPNHLSEGTNQDNINDKILKGRQGKKLTVNQIRIIREKYNSGTYTQYQLANEFDVNQSAINRIINLKSWSSV